MNIAEAFVKALALLGSRHCFAVPGGMAMHINLAMIENPDFQTVFCHHEQAAASAAEGYTKQKNFSIPGVCMVTSGPGITNSLTALLSSFADSAPVFVLAGQVKESDLNIWGLRTHGIQEVDSESIFKNAVKSFIRVSEKNFEDSIRSVFRNFFLGRKGPVVIEIPLNVQQLEGEHFGHLVETLFYEESEKHEKVIFQTELSKLRELVKASSKFSIYIGNGVRISGVETSQILEASNVRKIPRMYSWASQDLDESYANLNFGCPGALAPKYSNLLLQSSDLVLFLGARLDLATTAFQRNDFARNAKRVFVDIDDLELNKIEAREGDLKIQGDLNVLIQYVLESISEYQSDDLWLQKLVELKEIYSHEEIDKLKNSNLTVRELALVASEFVGTGTVVMSSSGYASETLARFYKSKSGVRFFCGGGLGAMGQGLAQGIGAICARSSFTENVLIIESDGGLWMSIHELQTLKAIDTRNVALINMNNGGYASIYNSQIRHFGRHFGTREDDGLILPNWEKLITALDIKYLRVETREQFSDFIEGGFPKGLIFIDYMIETTESRGPSLKTTMTNYGPKTEPLESIDW